jgi:hypothetical protein
MAVRTAGLELVWCDTSDMIADALTNGKVDRDVIRAAMHGQHKPKHETKLWRPLKRKRHVKRAPSWSQPWQ